MCSTNKKMVSVFSWLMWITSSIFLSYQGHGYKGYPLLRQSNRLSSLSYQRGISIAKLHDKKPALSELTFSLDPIINIWNFSRPHTIVGTTSSIISLLLYSTPRAFWTSPLFLKEIFYVLIPSLLTNIYITGLNQITDVNIDKINKPYLPLASGKMSMKVGVLLVSICFLLSVCFAWKLDGYLRPMIYGSLLLGTLYSLPPFRLKRFPLLASLCIVLVRGFFINFCIISHAKQVLGNHDLGSFYHVMGNYPEIRAICLFFSLFAFLIAIIKDIPDVVGDKKSGIDTYSVIFGPTLVFRFSTGLLTSLLLCATFFAQKVWKSSPGVTGVFMFGLYLAAATFRRSLHVDIKDHHSIFSFYMHVWKLFYLCYLLLPILAFHTEGIQK